MPMSKEEREEQQYRQQKLTDMTRQGQQAAAARKQQFEDRQLKRQAVAGTAPSSWDRWKQIMQGQGIYPTQPTSPAIGGGWDLIRRGAEITGESSPWLMPVLQSRLPEGAAPATVPAARASWGGTAPQYGGGGYGSGGWGGSYPSTAQQALWWDPGLYNWRYGVSY